MTLKQLDRSAVTVGKAPQVRILQFGEGNFLRAFVDWMIDIANERGVLKASVAVVSPRFRESKGLSILRRQQGLYHLILEGIEAGKALRQSRLISCITEVLSPMIPEDMIRYRAISVSPELRFIISNTTEAGIRFEPDDIMSDVPATFPGKIAALLWHRWKAFGSDNSKGLIFLPCELIEDNGTTLKEYVLRHAREAGLPEEFIAWVERDNIFADTLVDRIVPGFPVDTIREVQASLGYEDNCVVMGELYHLWVIGGNDYETIAAEFPLDKAGLNVLFMPDIKAFRDKKVRILNGSHTAMVPVALQLGCETVMDAFNNTQVNRLINTMVEREVLPVIDGNQRELKAFAGDILERFYNPYIKHYLKSIALNSLSKWEARNFPTVRDFWDRRGELASSELFCFAALLNLYAPGSELLPDDSPEHITTIRRLWNDQDYYSTVLNIVNSGIFIENFERNVPGFSAGVAEYLAAIRLNGMEKALEDFLS